MSRLKGFEGLARDGAAIVRAREVGKGEARRERWRERWGGGPLIMRGVGQERLEQRSGVRGGISRAHDANVDQL